MIKMSEWKTSIGNISIKNVITQLKSIESLCGSIVVLYRDKRRKESNRTKLTTRAAKILQSCGAW